MKFIISLLFLVGNHSFATNYHVSSAGSDLNSGLSTTAPFKTLLKVRSLKLVAGDSVLFKKGDIFRGCYVATNSGTPANRIVYGAYGEGELPIIASSKNLQSTGDWIVHSGNIWKTSTAVGAADNFYRSKVKDAGNIIFNGGTSCGKKVLAISACNAQGDWFISNGDSIYLFSTSNPGIYYSDVEIGGMYAENTFTIENRHDITVRDLDIRYSGNNTIFIYGCYNIGILNCKFQWIGGWYYDNASGRMGNGIQIWSANNGIEVSGNYVYEAYDAGISPQGNSTGYTQSNIHIHNNVFEKCYYTYEIFLRSPNIFSNIRFDNNTCIDAGYQWSQHQRPDSSDAEHIRQVISDGKITGCTIRNNIFYGGFNRYAQMDVVSGMVCDNNLIFGISLVGNFNGNPITTIEGWRKASRFDSHSIIVDPQLNRDHTLQPNSPCIDTGIDVGLPFKINSPDLGAFENTTATKQKTDLKMH